MREVRMTFGEHLEELRRRLFGALLWLSIAVTISFIYGKSLLKWTMGPHETAIKGALRDHSIGVLTEKGRELTGLTTAPAARLSGEPGREEPAAAGRSGWDDLFIADLRQSRLRASLRDYGQKLLLPRLGGQLSAEQLGGLMDGLADAIAPALGDEAAAVGARSLPHRFRLLEEELRRTALHTRATPIKRLLGVGRSLDDAIVPLAAFNQFLDARRKALEEAPPALAVRSTGSSELVRRLEGIYDDMQARARALIEDQTKPPIVISFLESFMTYFKVAMVFGLFFSTPLILYEMWKFVGAGLYPEEQRYVLLFMPFSLALFFGGALFGYFTVIPVALEFLAGWGSDLVELSFTLSNYVGLFFTLTVLLGLVAQTPLVMVFLGKIGAVTPSGFRKARKWAVLGSVVFAAVVTPPDPLSWSLVAGPMVLLYEVGILIVAASSRKKAGGTGSKPLPRPQGMKV
jgi:Tat protein translocase TatC